MVQCSFQSFWVVIKLLCLSLLVKTNTGPSICPLATSTIMYAVPIIMVSCCSDSFLFQKVSVFKTLITAYSWHLLCHLSLGTKKDMKDGEFWHCCQQIFHPAIAHMLQPLKAAMTVPNVIQCPDGHFCRAVYSLGPYIGDYPEQALLFCIIQGWCAK